MKRHGIRSRPGFTLIELLVVVAVIAIIAAILFPVFAQAREKARQASCLSNLKQLALGLIMYADDYDDRFPGGRGLGTLLWVPGPQGSWESMPTRCCGNVAPASVVRVLLPYVKNTQIFLCANDPTGDRFSNANPRFQWDGQIARASYETHEGLSQGWSWPTLPQGRAAISGEPYALGAVSRPALLHLVGDWWWYHGTFKRGDAWWNVGYADGHAKFTRFVDWGADHAIPFGQMPYMWNLYNPTRPVSMEKPCSPTCAEEAARG